MKLTLESPDMKQTNQATADVKGPGINATATFTEYDVDGARYVHLRLEVSSDKDVLSAGKHAVHVHEKGDCDCDGFKCAGGHFDPGPYGNTDPDANHGYHAGDLPSVTIDEDGKGILEAITTRFTLSDGPVSVLHQPEATSLMIHGNHDPYTPGETGSGHSGGPRMACGRIVQA